MRFGTPQEHLENTIENQKSVFILDFAQVMTNQLTASACRKNHISKQVFPFLTHTPTLFKKVDTNSARITRNMPQKQPENHKEVENRFLFHKAFRMQNRAGTRRRKRIAPSLESKPEKEKPPQT